MPITRFLEASVVAAELRIEKTRTGYNIRPLEAEELTAQELAAAGIAARRRTRTTDPEERARELEQARLLYAHALADDELRRRPTVYVKDTMLILRGKASRLLKEGREQEHARKGEEE